MSMKSFLSAGLGVCALGLFATTAQAAPSAGLADAIDRDAARSGLVENVTWYGRRHCHWHYGHRHCGYGHRYYRPYYGYGYYRPHYGHGHYHHYGHRRGWY